MFKSLQDVGVLVTRPAHQAHALCELITKAGGKTIIFPTLEIAEPRDKQAILQHIQRLAEANIIIFTSPNAVINSATLIHQYWPNLPKGLTWFAIGEGTANELKRQGLPVDFLPDDNYCSEGLLSLPALQDVKAKKITIFCGEGGRDLLAATLEKRGAVISEAIAYRRTQPLAEVTDLLTRWQDGEINIVISTSQEGLKNLIAIVGPTGRLLLLQTPLVVISERMANLVKELGFVHAPLIADNASDEAIFATLKAWKEKSNGR